MPKVKGQYKIIRLYNADFTQKDETFHGTTEKTIRENLTERQAIDHCKSKKARGTEYGKSYRDFYTLQNGILTVYIRNFQK